MKNFEAYEEKIKKNGARCFGINKYTNKFHPCPLECGNRCYSSRCYKCMFFNSHFERCGEKKEQIGFMKNIKSLK